MKRFAAFLIIATALLQVGIVNCQEFNSIDQQIESALQKSGTPGAVLVVVRDGKIIHARGYGYADLESHLKATSDTVWPIASITKTLLAIISSSRSNDSPSPFSIPDCSIPSRSATVLPQ